MSGLEIITGQQMGNALYPFFWQHGENQEVLGTYMEKIAESGMKAVCIEARPHPEFARAGWWKDLDFIIDKAKKSDMKLWILDDSHFPTGYANGKIKECYPQYLKTYLDMRRYDVQGPMRGARIDLRLLKGRPWEQPDDSDVILGVYMSKRISQKTDDGDAICLDQIQDITECMRMKDRLLTIDIPDGAYSIFVVFQTKNRGEEATKDYLNPLVKEATQILIQEVYEPHFQHYHKEFGNTIQGFFSDEPRFGNRKGTDAKIGLTDMVLPWKAGLEKELGFEKKYLPLLWVNAGGEERNIRYIYMDVVTKLYNDNFTKVLGDWCSAHGVWYLGHTIEDNGAHARLGYGTGHYFRGQQDMDFAGIDVIGTQIVPGMNYHHDAFSTGGCNGEFFHYALAKLGTSAAHLDPKKKGRTMCEAFGAYGWNEGLKTMKWIADHLMVRGVNYIVPHAFDPKEFPDADCPPHFYAHGHNPQFRYFSELSNYMNRIMSIIRGGVHPAKVGVFYPAEIEWAGDYMPVEKVTRELTTHQIAFDIVTLDYLKTAQIQEKCYWINGICFETLVIPGGSCLPAELAELIERMYNTGVSVFFAGERPDYFVGRDSIQQEKFLEICNQCRLVELKKIGSKLATYQSVIFMEEQPDLVVGEYQKEKCKYYMMFNENIGHVIHTKIKFKDRGYIYYYDALTDKLYQTESTSEGYELQLSPYETCVWVVSEEPLHAQPIVKKKQGRRISWQTDWEVWYADSRSYPKFKKKVPLNHTGLISDIEEWENVSGTARYENTVRIQSCEQLTLRIPEAFETVEVFVNGESAGIKICQPYEYNITKWIQQGENHIAIEVTNTLGTSIRDGMSHYLMIEPFGIRGEVTIEENCYIV